MKSDENTGLDRPEIGEILISRENDTHGDVGMNPKNETPGRVDIIHAGGMKSVGAKKP